MKRISIKIIAMLAILMLLFSINSKVFAWSNIIENGKSFIELGQQEVENNQKIKMDELKSLSSYLYNIFLAAGVVIAVVIAIILGIQFVTGGVEGQAKVKEMLIPFVVGCIIVFGGFSIWKLAITIGERVEKATITQAQESHVDSSTE